MEGSKRQRLFGKGDLPGNFVWDRSHFKPRTFVFHAGSYEMYTIHIRSIFRLFLPINAPSKVNVAIGLIAPSNQFGFTLQSADPTQLQQYTVRLFNVDDRREVTPDCFSFAKRKSYYFQPASDRANAIEGLFIRIRINHGFFDFRKSGTGGRINVRLDVSCLNNVGELLHSGSSPIFILLPKRRKAREGDDEGALENN